MNKHYRNRLLWLASILSRRATAIRRYVNAHTPPRKVRAPKPDLPPTPLERAFQEHPQRDIVDDAMRRIGAV